MSFISFIFMPAFPLRSVAGGNIHRKTCNISRSTAISDSFADSTPRRDQARSEMQLFHLGPWRHMGLASRACLTSLSWAFWIHGRTAVVVFSQVEAVRYSGLFEFHSCALCREVSHQVRNDGDTMPRAANHWGGAVKSQQCPKFSLQCTTFTPKIP